MVPQTYVMENLKKFRTKLALIAVLLFGLLASQVTFSTSSSASTDGMLDPVYGDSGTYTRLLTSMVGDSFPMYAQSVAYQGGSQFFVGKSTLSGSETNCIAVQIPDTGANDANVNRVYVYPWMKKSVTDFSWCELLAAGLDSTGKLVAVGYAHLPFQPYVCVIARFTTSGGLDTTFGDISSAPTRKGYTSISGNASCEFNSISIASTGEINVGGYLKATDPGLNRALLARYTTSGVLDTNFSTDGIVLQDYANASSESYLNEVHSISDGKVLTVGTSSGQTVLSMFTNLGALDSDFGASGTKVVQSIANTNLTVQKTIIDSASSKIFVYSGPIIQSLTYSGTLDTTFNSDGEITTESLGLTETNDILRDSTGKFYVLGRASSDGGTVPTVVRITSAGALDTTFSGDGRTQFGTSGIQPLAMGIDFDGNLHVSGRGGIVSGTNQAGLFGAKILTTSIAAPSAPVLTITATTASNYTVQIDSGTKPTTVANYSITYSTDGSTYGSATTTTSGSTTIPIEATNVRVTTQDIYGQNSSVGTLSTPTPTPTPTPSPSASSSSSPTPTPTPTVTTTRAPRVIIEVQPTPTPLPTPTPSITATPSPQPSAIPTPQTTASASRVLTVVANDFIQAPVGNLPSLDFLILSTTRTTSVSKALPFSFVVSTSRPAQPISISMKLPNGQRITIQKGKTLKSNSFKIPPIQFKSAGTYSLITKIGNKSKTVKIVVTE